MMTAEKLRAALLLEARTDDVRDWDVHHFAMWVYESADIPKSIQKRHRWAEGVVEKFLSDDEELMVQYALFKMNGSPKY